MKAHIISVNATRLDHATKELLRHGYKPEIAPLVDTIDMDVLRTERMYKRHDDPTDTTAHRAIALARTHSNLWKYENTVHIFEDDVGFVVNGSVIRHALATAWKFDRPFVFLGYCAAHFGHTLRIDTTNELTLRGVCTFVHACLQFPQQC